MSEGLAVATGDERERKYLHDATVIIADDESAVIDISELIKQGNQLVVLIPYRKPREEYDALTERLIETVEGSGGTVSLIQVGPMRPKGWRTWLGRLNATRALIVTPEVLADPRVVMTWVRETETGARRLVLGEMTTMHTGHGSQ
ncbi:MAG: hypothetical protein WAN34_13590 [Acidimicrobiia bacterium]